MSVHNFYCSSATGTYSIGPGLERVTYITEWRLLHTELGTAGRRKRVSIQNSLRAKATIEASEEEVEAVEAYWTVGENVEDVDGRTF